MVKAFNVLNWDINANKLISYNVLPYFIREYTELAKDKRPVTDEQWREFVRRKGMYMYWSRCEYEIIISPWPTQDKEVKIDIWKQIEMNIDLLINVIKDNVTER